MGKLSRREILRALFATRDVPKEWGLSIHGAPFYELQLRMSRIQELEYDFVWGTDNRFSSQGDLNLPDPSQILVLDVSLNDLTALESHQLSPFTHLRYLNASLNRIHSFNGVEVLRDLHFLNLSHNQISRLTFELTHCQSLVKLDLSVNQLDDVSTMPTLSNLRSLNLRSNKLKSLTGLQSLMMLEELHVQNNRLTDILPVAGCRCLRILNASNNKLSSLTAVIHCLKELPKLQNLSLYNNPVEKVLGYQATIVNNTTVCVLDNVTVRSQERRSQDLHPGDDADGSRHRRHWIVGHDGRHWMPIVDTARSAFEHQMARKKRQLDEDLRALHAKAALLQEEYQSYEAKTKREMEECLSHLRSVAYEDPRSFNYNYFPSTQRSLWPNVRSDEAKSPSISNMTSRLEPLGHLKPSYRNIVDTNEVLRYTYHELTKLQPQQKAAQMNHSRGTTLAEDRAPWDI